jgi:hypothetical protein
MQSMFSNALSKLISQHTGLSASRRETLSWLVLLITQFGSVCLWRLAAHVQTGAELSSVRRRISRFFQHVTLDPACAARIVVALAGLEGKAWVLSIDRTNWCFGRATINFLVVAVEWNGIGIPLIWTLLPKDGNSSAAERIDLLGRLFEAFPAMRVAAFAGDREFIGQRWMDWLIERKVPFDLRFRENQMLHREGFAAMPAAAIAKRLKPGQKLILKQPCRLGETALPVRVVLLRLASGELLALATSGKPRGALARYARRWRIESLFANLKSKGFNLEDTHITGLTRLATLMGLLAIAVALAAKSGVTAAARKPIPVKNHGRPQASIFAHGRACLCRLFASANRLEIARGLRKILGVSPDSRVAKSCQV